MGRHAVDMTGWIMKEHGVPDSRLTVLHRTNDYIDSNGVHYIRWMCKCECGNTVIAIGTDIRKGHIKSCGCFLQDTLHNIKFIDLTGQKFGRWTVLYQTNDHINPSGRHIIMWHCKCECGNEKDVSRSALTSGASQSCGCLWLEKVSCTDETLRQYDNGHNLIGKVCQCCKRMLSIDNYYNESTNIDGYSSVCKYCQRYSLEHRYQVYKRNAKKRNLIFEIEKCDFDILTTQPCYYCGEYSGEYFDKPFSGLYRIDSSTGYTINNVVPCCETCNKMKSNYDIHDWLNKIKTISKRFEEGVIHV